MRGYVVILTISLLVAVGLARKYQQDIDSARENYRQEQSLNARDGAKNIEQLFKRLYEGLRTISRLPGVRQIDRHADNFENSSRLTTQELYNNIANEVSVSEIYIVPLEFDPESIDPLTGEFEMPTVMFDELIVGRVGGPIRTQSNRRVRTHPEIEETEIQEYRLIARQLIVMKDQFPTEDRLQGLGVPAFLGEEIITCDNTRFNPDQPRDDDRSGLVYSLPFYSTEGKLKGCISGIILTEVIRDHLPIGNYVLGHKESGYFVAGHGSQISESSQYSIQQLQPDPHLIYSETLAVNITDETGPWRLWTGQPNSVFWSRRDVKLAIQFTILGYSAWGLLTMSSLVGFWMTRRHNSELKQVNQALQTQRSLLERSGKIVKRFSQKILSVREEEKKSLARELHDRVGTMAISLNAALAESEQAITANNQREALKTVCKTRELVSDIVSDLKNIAINLRPLNLETVGLEGALQELCSTFTRSSNLNIQLSVKIDGNEISDEQAIALYRIAQESLNNIVKHAKAENVVISLIGQDNVTMEIADDGGGFNHRLIEDQESDPAMGILGMQERAESLGGKLVIESSRGRGTRIRVTFKQTCNSEKKS